MDTIKMIHETINSINMGREVLIRSRLNLNKLIESINEKANKGEIQDTELIETIKGTLLEVDYYIGNYLINQDLVIYSALDEVNKLSNDSLPDEPEVLEEVKD